MIIRVLMDASKDPAKGLGRYDVVEVELPAVPQISNEIFLDGRSWLVERVQFDVKETDKVSVYVR